jgi:hypothetical protein
LLLAAAVLMVATGLGFATITSLWPLLSWFSWVRSIREGGDVSVFLPLEHTVLAASASAEVRTSVFARYSFVGSVFAAVGALAAAVPDWLASGAGWQMLDALRAMFVVYAALGAAVWVLYLRMPQPPRTDERTPPAALGPSRGIVLKLAGLFSVDSFAGAWSSTRCLRWLFGASASRLPAPAPSFLDRLLSAVSQLAAPALARRVGLVNTMVFTHIPASLIGELCVIAEVALGLLLVRSML